MASGGWPTGGFVELGADVVEGGMVVGMVVGMTDTGAILVVAMTVGGIVVSPLFSSVVEGGATDVVEVAGMVAVVLAMVEVEVLSVVEVEVAGMVTVVLSMVEVEVLSMVEVEVLSMVAVVEGDGVVVLSAIVVTVVSEVGRERGVVTGSNVGSTVSLAASSGLTVPEESTMLMR